VNNLPRVVAWQCTGRESAFVCQPPRKMADEINSENGRISNFQCHAILILDEATSHTVMHHSSTSTRLPTYQILFELEKLSVDGRTDVRNDRQTSRPTLLGRLGGVAGWLISAGGSGADCKLGDLIYFQCPRDALQLDGRLHTMATFSFIIFLGRHSSEST